MTSVRVLGACGLLSAALSMLGGFIGVMWLIGIASLVMLLGNLFALVNKE